MFSSFFPKPKLFFGSALVWAGLCMAIWYAFGRDLGAVLSLGRLFGYGSPAIPPDTADAAQKALFEAANGTAIDIWVYQYLIICGAIFAAAWHRLSPQRWFWWSVVTTGIILFVTWFQVQLNVMINNWFGVFYNMVQRALGAPGSVTTEEA